MNETLNILQEGSEKTKDTGDFIVAIGASAGGLEAIHEFFDNISDDTGMAFVIIQHLSPDYKSLLVELVGKHTKMSVHEAEDGMTIEKNCVYVIPNKKLITVKGDKLKLEEKSTIKGPNTAIDSFLYTLAREKGRQAIAIILSGTGTDGTKGIEKIKQAGGMVMVQDPVTAKFDGMPNSAIASENVDFILPPELMPAELYEFVRINPANQYENAEIKENLLSDIFALIHHGTGWDFNYYKRPTIYRRINKRMVSGGFKTLEEYVEYLHKNPVECQELSKDFLIGVTKFFRDKAAYDLLMNEVFPELIKSKESGDFVKIWISACSTGEEAYSIAILLDQYLSTVKKIVNVKIFATDIDQRAIEVAGKGWYSQSIENDIEADILSRYFVREGSGYSVVPQIRKQIVFACHNLLKDPPFIKNDLISCRNMLIYMDSTLQRKVLSNFHFSLNNNGYLFLGSSENAANLKDKMEEISSRWKIYKKWGSEPAQTNSYSYSAGNISLVAESRVAKFAKKPILKTLSEDFKEVLAEDLGFAGVYINANYEVKEAVGNYRKYLSLPDKVLNLNILKMLPKDVAALLSTSLRQSAKQEKKVTLRNVKFTENGKRRFMNVFVRPPSDASTYFLLIFNESFVKHEHAEIATAEVVTENADRLLLNELEAELKETKLNLQTAIEELETTNEELQSSNEELLSSNEELQSSNEELQSLNEELHTLNTEHQLKIRELIELNNDLDNYFRTTDIGQIFLDDKMRIRKFNTAAVRMINLIETDIGRPIDHISTNIRDENLLADIQSVMKSRQMIEKEITLSKGSSCLLRITPYLLHDKRPFGAVITFVDISALKDLDNIIKGVFNSNVAAIMAFKSVRNVSQEIIDFKWIAANHSAEKLVSNKSLNEDNLLSKEFPSFNKAFFDKLADVVASDKPFYTEYCQLNEDEEKCYDLVAVKMSDGLVVTFADTTEKREAENRLKRNFNELNATKEKLRKLNTELENKVAERTKELSESEERFQLVSKATNDAIWDWNLSNNETWWSEGYQLLFGYDRNNDENRRQFWNSKIHPDDIEKVSESLFKVINHSGDSWSAEYRILKSDGTYATVFDRGFLLKDEYGTPFRMVGSIVDITKLRTAEQDAEASHDERRFLAETIPLIVWTASPGGKLHFLNNHFTQYTGISLEDALGFGWKKVIVDEDYANLKQSFISSMDQKNDFSIEVRLQRHDGENRWHLLRARAKKDASNKLVSWVGTLTDIHEQKQTNEILEKKVAERTMELQNAIRELEISNNNLQQFTYIASHDLKEPLRKIFMFSTEIKRRFLENQDKTANDYIDKVISSSHRLTKLINDLLSFSTISSNNHFQKTNLQKLINDVLSDLELVINEKKAVVNVSNLPVIEAVAPQIRQVFQNIISNALKFNRKGLDPVIEITCESIREKDFNSLPDEKGNYVRIKIKDNGIGFEEQYLDKIFMIFQRLHSKTEFEGTGIGLAITKSIIDKHGGFITATSVQNEGSTFIIILPRVQTEQ